MLCLVLCSVMVCIQNWEGEIKKHDRLKTVTCAIVFILLKSIFTRVVVRSQGIVTLSIYIRDICFFTRIIYVVENKVSITIMSRLLF